MRHPVMVALQWFSALLIAGAMMTAVFWVATTPHTLPEKIALLRTQAMLGAAMVAVTLVMLRARITTTLVNVSVYGTGIALAIAGIVTAGGVLPALLLGHA